MDKLLMSDYETANYRLEHAMNYLGNIKMHPEAYDEFKEVLREANDAFPKVEEFSDKVFIQRISIFSRFMTHCYDKERKQFLPLSSLSVEDKQTIANAVFIDLNVVLKEFNSMKRCSFYKKNLEKKRKIEIFSTRC